MRIATVLTMAAILAASPALAQDMRSQSSGSATTPPGGSYQGYTNSRDRGQQQAAVPTDPATGRKHPGTLRKFNSNSGYGPEVEFEVERREAAQARQQQQKMR